MTPARTSGGMRERGRHRPSDWIVGPELRNFPGFWKVFLLLVRMPPEPANTQLDRLVLASIPKNWVPECLARLLSSHSLLSRFLTTPEKYWVRLLRHPIARTIRLRTLVRLQVFPRRMAALLSNQTTP